MLAPSCFSAKFNFTPKKTSVTSYFLNDNCFEITNQETFRNSTKDCFWLQGLAFLRFYSSKHLSPRLGVKLESNSRKNSKKIDWSFFPGTIEKFKRGSLCIRFLWLKLLVAIHPSHNHLKTPIDEVGADFGGGRLAPKTEIHCKV